MQALTLLLAVAVGPGSGRPHSTPPPPRSHWVCAQCTRPPSRAGRAKGLPQTRLLGGVPCLHAFPRLLETSAWLSPAGSILSRGWPSGSGEECCPLLESPGWAVPTLTPQWKAAQLPLLLFVFKGELNMLTKQETQPQHQPRLSAVYCPLPEWAQCIQLPSLSSSPGKPHAHLSLRISPHAWHHSCP